MCTAGEEVVLPVRQKTPDSALLGNVQPCNTTVPPPSEIGTINAAREDVVNLLKRNGA